MQLFILDRHPILAAQMLCDTHLRKMCLETSQILSGVMFHRHLPLRRMMPQVYNPHHPVITAINSPAKINWVLRYNAALHNEYFYRFGKYHAYYPLSAIYIRILYTPGIPQEENQWDFARSFKDMKCDEPDIVEAYRRYYRFKKQLIRNWNYSRRPEPYWLNDEN